MQPVDAAPLADAGGGEGDHAADARRQQQAQVEGVGQQEGQRPPGDQGAVGGRDVEDLAEHDQVQHEAGEGHHRRQLGEVARGVAALDRHRQAEAGQRRAEQDRHLRRLAEVAPELVEEEEHAGRQRQRAEEGSHAHAQRQLPRLQVAVDVEAAGEGGQQCVVVRAQRLRLRRIERQHAFGLPAAPVRRGRSRSRRRVAAPRCAGACWGLPSRPIMPRLL
jgi:hypothetical protein